jgi:ubiquinone biosynthesis protein UbiJ
MTNEASAPKAISEKEVQDFCEQVDETKKQVIDKQSKLLNLAREIIGIEKLKQRNLTK